MVTILIDTVIISMFCLGLAVLTEENMLLYFLRRPFERKSAEWYKSFWCYFWKPIILCPPCMASFWGSIVFIILHGISISLLPYLIICCISSVFVIAFAYRKHNN